MTRSKKISLWVAGVLGSLLLLVLMAVIALPLLVNQPQVKEKIRARLSRQLGGEVKFNTVRASLLPPQGKISGIRFRVPGISGTAGSVAADFKILPLFIGRLKIDEIVLTDADVTVPLPEAARETGKPQAGPDEWTPARIREKVSGLLSRIEAGLPGVSITVQKTAVALTRNGQPLYRLQNVQAEIGLPPKRLAIKLTAASDIWESLTFSGKIDADGSNAGGQLGVTRLRPEPLVRFFVSNVPNDLESARVTLKLGFKSADFATIHANLEGSVFYEKIPYPVKITKAEFAYGGEALVLNDFNIQAGESHIGASTARLDLKEAKNLEIESAAADLYLDRVLPWALPLLSRFERIKDLAADYKELKGKISFSSLNLQGPLRQPEKWKFSVKGTLENLLAGARKLPAPLKLQRAEFEGSEDRMTVKLRNLSLLTSALSLSGYIENPLADTAAIDVSARGEIDSSTVQWIAGKFNLPAKITAVRGGIEINELNVKGPILKPKELSFNGNGAVENLVVETGLLPAAVAVDRGGFAVAPDVLTLNAMQVHFLSSSMNVSGSLKGFMKGPSALDLKFNGTVGEQAAAWLKDRQLVPSWANIAPPVSLTNGHLIWGREPPTVLAADLAMANRVRLAVELVQSPQKLTIKNFTLNDPSSHAQGAMTLGADVYEIDFRGKLAEETLRKLIKGRPDLIGWMQGDFKLHISNRRPTESRFQGTIQAGGFSYLGRLNSPVRVQQLSLQGEGNKIRIDSADLLWRETDINVSGTIGFSSNRILLDLVAQTKGFDWEKINRIVKAESRKGPVQTGQKRKAPELAGVFGDMKLEGQVTLKADYFKYRELTWKPFQAVINIEGKHLGVRLAEGNLCGIQTEASARVTPEPMRLEGEVKARNEPLGAALNCLLESKLMSGDFDLAGELTTRGSSKSLLDNLQGQFNFTAEDGRIFRFGLLAKILAVVNITEILKGEAPDLEGEGFGYKTAKASGEISDGTLTLHEAYINGKSVDLAFAGGLNIPEKRIDLTVLVTPLKTVDSIIQRIPIVGYLAGKNFMAIPVRVTGALSDPTVTPLPASEVGKGLLGVLERTLKLPVKVFQPFLPHQGK